MTESQPPVIKCPSCGHANAPSVNNCIICDFPLSRVTNQTQTRRMTPPGVLLEQPTFDDNFPSPHPNKTLGPLPDSNMLVDKQRSKANMTIERKCPDCGHVNRAGTFICVECGFKLVTNSNLDSSEKGEDHHERDTQTVPQLQVTEYDKQPVSLMRLEDLPDESDELDIPLLLNEPGKVVPVGSIKFMSWMTLRLDVIGFETPIMVHPRQEKPMLIGRAHPTLPIQPHIDLTPYLKEKHGVSRRHALLRLQGVRLEIQDLNSTNGTSINGVRFMPKEVNQIRNGDLLMLGQVKIRVTFVPQESDRSKGLTDELRL